MEERPLGRDCIAAMNTINIDAAHTVGDFPFIFQQG